MSEGVRLLTIRCLISFPTVFSSFDCNIKSILWYFQCTKTGKQGSSTIASKSNQTASSTNTDRKSPNAPSTASSPKPANTPTSASNSKTSTPAPESDGEDDRSKSSDSGSAPKVPPLKIVIPQSTTSEQEQGNRNGKNPLNRGHQLPYVVASSNSNDSMDKEPGQSASGTTSPTESTKGDDKKEPTAEERSTHHQRVLRSSHRYLITCFTLTIGKDEFVEMSIFDLQGRKRREWLVKLQGFDGKLHGQWESFELLAAASKLGGSLEQSISAESTSSLAHAGANDRGAEQQSREYRVVEQRDNFEGQRGRR